MVGYQSVFQLFEAQAALNPGNAAFEEQDGTIHTYNALSRSVDSIARRLRREHLAACRGPLIAILVEERKDFIIAALAVLKCGKGFVPLDPEYPQDRLLEMMADLNNPVLISTSALPILGSLSYNSKRMFFMGGETDSDDENPEDAWPVYYEHDIMYCLYTSGSTGVPKGVLIEHCSVLNWIDWAVDEFGLGENDRSLAFSNPTFDLSIAQIFPLLSTGGTVVEPERWTGATALHKYSNKKRITFLYLPTFVAETFFETYESLDLRWLLFAGEVVRKWGFQLPATMSYQIVNIYGPTEATLGSTFQKFRSGDTLSLSVGLPIANHQVYLLDDIGSLILTPNVKGLVHLQGIGVTERGYHNRPRESKDYFIEWNDQRLCKPGDIGSWNSEGGLEIHGRIDDQIKIMGRRFELGEIEFHLTQNPLVREAVVVFNKETGVLVAFITKNQTDLLDEMLLKAYLFEKIPKEAVPSQIIQLSQFPLNSSGKVDKRELLKLAEVKLTRGNWTFNTAFEFESMLGDEWANVLHVPRSDISADTNFFSIGGDSHVAVILIAKLRQVLPPVDSLRVVTVFTHSSLSSFTAILYKDLVERASTHVDKEQPLPDVTAPFLLSYGQEQMWLSLERSAKPLSFNVVRVVEFKGNLDKGRLKRALQQTLKLNPVLRTTYFTKDQQAWQMIQNAVHVNLELLDTRMVGGLKRHLENLWKTRLHLKTGPLIRFFIWEPTQKLVLLYHHLLMDGTGWSGFIRSVDKYYNNKYLSTNSDYMATVCKERGCVISLESLEYWKNKLQGMKPVPCLQKFKEFTSQASPMSCVLATQLDRVVLDGLKELARCEGTTLFTLLITIFKVLTYRIHAEGDQTLLTLIRTGSAQDTDVMGHFVNLLPVRTVFNKTDIPNFTHYLKMVKQALAGGLQHGSVPFQRILDVVKPKPEVQESLLQLVFQMRIIIQPRLEICSEVCQTESAYSGIDFGMEVGEEEKGLALSIEYNCSKYPPSFVEQFLHLYTELCSSILVPNAKNISISQLRIMPASMHSRILTQFTNTVIQLNDTPDSILQCFLNSVRQWPNSRCIRDDSGSEALEFSYTDLDQLSNRMKLLIGRPTYLVLLLSRSAKLIVATLAGLKSNCVLVPLPLTQTQTHFEMVLSDLDGDYILIAESGTLEQIPPSVEKDRILLMETLFHGEEHSKSEVPRLGHSDVVFCFYTSGTTGRPKGVLITQRGLLNFVKAYQHTCGISPDDTALLINNPEFDISLTEFLPALASGANVVIPAPHISHDPAQLWKYICDKKVTYACLPTFVATNIFYEFEKFSHFSTSLRCLAFGGERLRVSPPAIFPARCVNIYGPTETTMYVSEIEATPASVARGSVGRPIRNARVYILDKSLNLLPPHFEGMIWIGGSGVSKGYLKRESETVKSFKSNPFVDGEQMFRSGDLGAWTDHGEIVFSSRADQQVKLNGFRIELEEIEARLSAHPQVVRAAVVSVEQNGSAFLVAFFVPLENLAPPTSDVLKQFLAYDLAYYAVPQVYIPFPQINLTSNMKIDRRALRELFKAHHLSQIHHGNEVPKPLTPTESLLASIWNSMLGVETTQINADTSFYEVGGTSLKIGTLLQKIDSTFDLRLTFRDLVRNTTLGGLSTFIDERSNSGLSHSAVLTKAQEDAWFEQTFKIANKSSHNKYKVLKLEPEASWEAISSKVQTLFMKNYNVLGLGTSVSKDGRLLVTRFTDQDLDRVVSLNLKQVKANDMFNLADAAVKISYDLLSASSPLFRVEVVHDGKSTWLFFCFNSILFPPQTLFQNLAMLGLCVDSGLEPYHHSPKLDINENKISQNVVSLSEQNHWKALNNADNSQRHEIWTSIIIKATSLILQVPVVRIQNGIIKNKQLSLEDLGGSRISILKLYTTLLKLTGTTSPSYSEIHKSKTLAGLIEILSQYMPTAMEDTDYPINCIFELELTDLLSRLAPSNSSSTGTQAGQECLKNGSVVFLTGGTGYLGTFMLGELLQNQSVTKIYVLVREGVERVFEALQKNQIEITNLEKLVPVQGDLSLPKLGLTPHNYTLIYNEVHLVYHCGAETNLVKDYNALRSPNVLGTFELCKLAMDSRTLRGLYLVSSCDYDMGRFLFETKEQVMEETISNSPPYFEIGYYQTKWMAEKLIEFTGQRVSTMIFRVGTFGAPSDERELINRGSFDGSLLRASVKLESFPDFKGFSVPYSDVDFIAKFICKKTILVPALGTPTPALVFNIVQQSYTFAKLFSTCVDKVVSPMSPECWFEKFKAYCEITPEDELSQRLFVALQQRPWANLSSLYNMFQFITSMPYIHYPMDKCSGTNDPDCTLTSIKKFTRLHSDLA